MVSVASLRSPVRPVIATVLVVPAATGPCTPPSPLRVSTNRSGVDSSTSRGATGAVSSLRDAGRTGRGAAHVHATLAVDDDLADRVRTRGRGAGQRSGDEPQRAARSPSNAPPMPRSPCFGATDGASPAPLNRTTVPPIPVHPDWHLGRCRRPNRPPRRHRRRSTRRTRRWPPGPPPDPARRRR